MKNVIITISREFGAGGHTIGIRVAKELGIEIYDKDIVKETVRASGFDPELVKKEEEDVSTRDSILKAICAASSPTYQDTQGAIHEIQKAVILKFASEGPCVILGRCADVVLREAGIDCLNVFITADDLHRAVRASEMTGVKDATELQKILRKKDAARHNYYTRFTGKRWGDSHNYHLCLDSGVLGYDQCVKIITDTVRSMQEEA